MNKTKWLGSKSELLVAADLMNKGYYVYTEMGDNSPIDLVAIHNENLKQILRVQVKAAKVHNGTITVYGNNSTRSYCRVYNKDDFDVFAVHVYERNIILYIPIEDVIRDDKKSSTLWVRIDPPQRNQKKRINFYEQYLNLTI